MYSFINILIGFVLSSSILFADIKIEGSSTVLPIIKDVRKQYKKLTNEKIIVKGGGSGKGIKSLLNGDCDISMVSRDLTQEEKNLGLIRHTIGYDGIGIIVNSQLDIENLDNKNLKDIYEGKIKNWKIFSGKNKQITVISKIKGRATKKLFDKYFNLITVSKDALLVGSNTEDIIFVASQPNAIGYVSIGTALSAIKKGVNIKLIKLNDIEPTTQNVLNKTYPMVRTLNLITKQKPTKKVLRFIEFMKDPYGQKKVIKRNFVGIK